MEGFILGRTIFEFSRVGPSYYLFPSTLSLWVCWRRVEFLSMRILMTKALRELLARSESQATCVFLLATPPGLDNNLDNIFIKNCTKIFPKNCNNQNVIYIFIFVLKFYLRKKCHISKEKKNNLKYFDQLGHVCTTL